MSRRLAAIFGVLVFAFGCAGLRPSLEEASAPDSQTPFFEVMCDRNGDHSGCKDCIEPEREEFLVRWWIGEGYPGLPPDLQQMARRSLFQINHRQLPATKMFMGWSAEDDVDWKGDNRLWVDGGTIKVNISERAIQLLDFVYKYVYEARTVSPDAWNSARERMFVGFLGHEVIHEVQYTTRPVRDLERFGDGCPEGLCAKDLIAENRQKVAYELEAILWHFGNFRTPSEAFVQVYTDAVGANPELFREGGRYSLLGGDYASSYLQLGKLAQQVVETREFTGGLKATYAAQVELAEMAWRIKELNDALEAAKKAGALNRETYEASRGEVVSWKASVESFRTLGKRYEDMKIAMSYIGRAETRFFREVERFERLGDNL